MHSFSGGQMGVLFYLPDNLYCNSLLILFVLKVLSFPFHNYVLKTLFI